MVHLPKLGLDSPSPSSLGSVFASPHPISVIYESTHLHHHLTTAHLSPAATNMTSLPTALLSSTPPLTAFPSL